MNGEAVAELVLKMPFPGVPVWLVGVDVNGFEPILHPNGPAEQHVPIRVRLVEGCQQGTLRAELRDVVRQPHEPALLRGQRKIRRDPKTRAATVHRVVHQAKVEAIPELIQGPGPARIQVAVSGASAAEPQIIQYPLNWRVESLKPGEFQVTELPGAGAAELGIGVGGVEARILLLPAPPVVAEHVPAFIVGIDFGTSCTSVWYRDVVSGAEEPLGEKRFPTQFFIRDPLNPTGWLCGKAVADLPEGETGLRVTELKRLLWEGATQVPGGGPHHPTPEKLLHWYFKWLKQTLIRPALEAIAQRPLDEICVLWQVSMPILATPRDGRKDDEHQERERRYREILEHVGRSNLCGPLDQVRIGYEPKAALRCILEEPFENRTQMCEGDRICLIDSGAGTTDAVYGILKADGAGWTIDEAKTIAITIPSARKRGLLVDYVFGGGDVTRLMASLAIAEGLRANG